MVHVPWSNHGSVHAAQRQGAPIKARFFVYCALCACGVQYVGETERNLKLRLSEHLRNSSTSSFSGHILQDNVHRVVLNSTQILAREKHPQKHKIIETLCIKNKKSKLCNNSVSVELPKIWKTCAREVAKQVAFSDWFSSTISVLASGVSSAALCWRIYRSLSALNSSGCYGLSLSCS